MGLASTQQHPLCFYERFLVTIALAKQNLVRVDVLFLTIGCFLVVALENFNLGATFGQTYF